MTTGTDARTNTASPLLAIGQIAVTARDLDRAVTFYRDALGLRFLFRAGERMAFFDCGGVRLMLGLPEPGEAAGRGSILYVRTDGIEGAHEALRSRGVRFEAEPHRVARLEDHELWLAFFRDSEDNLLAIMEEKPL